MNRRVLAVAAIALLAPGAASAGRVGWNETAKVGSARVMSYQVVSLTIRQNSWSARISFKNLSRRTIAVGSEFGVAFYADRSATSLSAVVGFATATRFSTPTPKALKPGASWSGVISGSGQLGVSGLVYARVVFGPFSGVPGASSAIVWITDHATTFGAGVAAPVATGPII